MNQLGFNHHFIPSPSNAISGDETHKETSKDNKSKSLTLLLLHGTGRNEDDLIPVGQMLSSSASLLSPRGKVLEHGMPRFFRRLAEGVFDIDDLKFRTQELAKFVYDASLKTLLTWAKQLPWAFQMAQILLQVSFWWNHKWWREQCCLDRRCPLFQNRYQTCPRRRWLYYRGCMTPLFQESKQNPFFH